MFKVSLICLDLIFNRYRIDISLPIFILPLSDAVSFLDFKWSSRASYTVMEVRLRERSRRRNRERRERKRGKRAISPAEAVGDQSQRARRELYGPARNDKRLRSRCVPDIIGARVESRYRVSRWRTQRGPCATMRDTRFAFARA